MDVSLTEPHDDDPMVEPGEVPFSLRPNREHWRATLRAAAAARARSARPWAGQRAAAAAAAVVGWSGVAALATLAIARPSFGGQEYAAVLSVLAVVGLPVWLSLRRGGAGEDGPASHGDAPRAATATGATAPDEGEAAARWPSPPAPGPVPQPLAVRRFRRHVRITPRVTRTFITTPDGRRLNAIIQDVSQSGVALLGNFPGLWIGSMARVGRRRAKVVRAISRGMAFEFSEPVSDEDFTADLVL